MRYNFQVVPRDVNHGTCGAAKSETEPEPLAPLTAAAVTLLSATDTDLLCRATSKHESTRGKKRSY